MEALWLLNFYSIIWSLVGDSEIDRLILVRKGSRKQVFKHIFCIFKCIFFFLTDNFSKWHLKTRTPNFIFFITVKFLKTVKERKKGTDINLFLHFPFTPVKIKLRKKPWTCWKKSCSKQKKWEKWQKLCSKSTN